MAFTVATLLVLRVEIQVAGVWTDITTRGRAASQVTISVGRSANANSFETSRLEVDLGNADAFLTEDNPLSPWYGSIGRGCPIRLSNVISGVAHERFSGAIDTMTTANPGGPDQVMRVTAVGTLGQLNQGQAFKSALARSMTGVSAGDYVPYASWSLEDESGSSGFASDLTGGAPMQAVGAISYASNSASKGSMPLPVFNAGAFALATIPAYTNTNKWITQIMVYVPSAPAAETTYAEIRLVGTSSSPLFKLSVEPGTPARVHVRGFDGSSVQFGEVNRLIDGAGGAPSEAQFYGSWIMYTIGFEYSSSWNLTLTISHDSVTTASTSLGQVGTGAMVGSVRLLGDAAGIGFGHLAVFVDPAFTIGTDDKNNAAAMNGYDGETTGTRYARIMREEGVTGSYGGPDPLLRMGPQPTGTLTAILAEIEAVDQGFLHDRDAGGALKLVGIRVIENLNVGLAITTDAISSDATATWDNQTTANDVTSSRPGGSSARLSDEVNVAKLRSRNPLPRTVNVYTDDMLVGDAGWALNIGTAPGPRYTSFPINMRNANAVAYAAAVLDMTIGSRMTVAPGVLPTQFPTGGVDAVVIGWTEVLDADTWLWRPNLMPFSPYLVGVYAAARYDSATSTLTAGVSASVTSLSVATTGPTLWSTTAAPFDIAVAGERMTVTAVTGASSPQTFTVVRAVNGIVKAQLINAPVTLWTRSRYAH